MINQKQTVCVNFKLVRHYSGNALSDSTIMHKMHNALKCVAFYQINLTLFKEYSQYVLKIQ